MSGLLVDSPIELTTALGDVLRDHALRTQLSKGAREVSHTFTWEHAQESFAVVLREVLVHRQGGQPGPRRAWLLSRAGHARRVVQPLLP